MDHNLMPFFSFSPQTFSKILLYCLNVIESIFQCLCICVYVRVSNCVFDRR